MLLIVTNLFSIYIHEKDESAFLYVYEEKEQYQNYLQGNIVEETYYQWIDEQQAEYLKSYPVFLGEMENRAEALTKLSTYSEMESFVILKIICADLVVDICRFHAMARLKLKRSDLFPCIIP